MADSFFYQLSSNAVVFSATLTQSTPYSALKPRNHESIFIVTDGTLLYERGDDKTLVHKGSVGYISRGSIDRSSAYGDGSVSYIAVNFQSDNEHLFPTLPFKTVAADKSTYEFGRLFKKALDFFTAKLPGYTVICNGIVTEIIGLLYNRHHSSNDSNPKTKSIESATDYLKSHYSNANLTISEIAQMANFSEKQFRRIFTEAYKDTPYRFLQKLRIDNAKILLSNTQMPILAIAQSCGFSDSFSFSHCFKNHVGTSPSQYRENTLKHQF